MEEANNNNANQQNESRTIREVQQSFAASLGYFNETIWDLLSHEQADILMAKIRNIIPDPKITADVADDARKKLEKQCKANEVMRETLFNSIWEQRKYTNRQSLTSIFYVMVATDETDHNVAPDSKTWSCHPVFRARRCVSDRSGNNSSDCCMIFVDEKGRVYQNWKAYVANNELPAGIMVAPARGVYNLVGNVVKLEAWITPAASPRRKVLGVLDMTTAIGGLGAACVPIAAVLTLPVAAPVMAVAGAVGLGCAGYATARSGAQLADRSIHEQSISVTDRTARNHWLGVIAGAVGLGAAGATSAMTAATSAGREVGAITQMTVNGMNITTIMVSGTGVANGVVELFLKYQDGDDISAMDALQLSASLVLFTHSVYNFKLASTIISETSNSRIGAYRETLSNRQRRMFDKLSKETIRTRGATRGKLDIIRNVNEMPSRQQFNDLYKINRQLNEKGVRPTFDSNGKGIVLNDQVKTSGAELRASVQHKVGPDLLGQVTQPIPESYNVGGNNGKRFTAPARLLAPNPTLVDQTDMTNRNYAEGVGVLRLSSLMVNGVSLVLSKYGQTIFEHIVNAESFETVLLSLADNLPEDVMRFALNMVEIFMDNLWEELHELLQFYLSSESVLYRIGTHILDNYSGLTAKQLSDQFSEILIAVKEYYLSLNPNRYREMLTKCKECGGFYDICAL
ncbi:uncharacterized protein pst isoform X2 [Drosophila montana]|uniref:uncharacterized protein pst isoform X2 n=1 Tax=Drosophila montana TaxID=40370 RepID=UPI00313CBC14